jgi:hypothetical protein
MTYPSYRIKEGFGIEEYSMFFKVTQDLNITGPLAIVTTKPYWIDGIKQQFRSGEGPEDLPEVSILEACDIYCNFQRALINWIDSLKEGDQVVIEYPRGATGDYPYHFTSEMQGYSGKTMTIRSIISYPAKGFRFSNSSNRCFILEEDPEEFNWHSSMFEMGPIVKIASLELTEIDFDPLK